MAFLRPVLVLLVLNDNILKQGETNGRGAMSRLFLTLLSAVTITAAGPASAVARYDAVASITLDIQVLGGSYNLTTLTNASAARGASTREPTPPPETSFADHRAPSSLTEDVDPTTNYKTLQILNGATAEGWARKPFGRASSESAVEQVYRFENSGPGDLVLLVDWAYFVNAFSGVTDPPIETASAEARARLGGNDFDIGSVADPQLIFAFMNDDLVGPIEAPRDQQMPIQEQKGRFVTTVPSGEAYNYFTEVSAAGDAYAILVPVPAALPLLASALTLIGVLKSRRWA